MILYNSIPNKTQEKFRTLNTAGVDLLLVMIFNFCRQRRNTREFFHTLMLYYDDRKQIVLTSDSNCLNGKFRKYKNALFRDLLGAYLYITPPDLETRLCYFTKKANAGKIEIPEIL